MLKLLSVLIGVALMMPAAAAIAQSDPGAAARGASGLPLPRYVTLGSNKVFMRTGPGQQYPIEWVYQRRGLPVEIVAEYDLWRRVRDIDGAEGWMHKQLLSGKRSAIVIIDLADLHKKPDALSPIVLRAEKHVQGRLERCDIEWCRVEIADVTGWLKKSAIWGAYPAEIFR